MFASLYGDEPCHSFDGFAFSVHSKRKLWLHLDQSFDCASAFDSVQAVLALSDTPEHGYTTAFCHCDDIQQLLSECRRAFPERSQSTARVHFFNDDEVSWLLQRSTLIRPTLKRGELLIWCSGIPHCALGRDQVNGFPSYLSNFPCSSAYLESKRAM